MSSIQNMKELKAEVSRLKEISGYQWKQLGYDLKDIRSDLMPGRFLWKVFSFLKRDKHKND